jgi:bilirubin oxidase
MSGDFPFADPGTTGQVMRFTVVDRVGDDASADLDELAEMRLPSPPKPTGSDRTRTLVLLEADSEVLAGVGPPAAFLGTLDDGKPVRHCWDDAITENPRLGDTEV